MGYAKIRFWPAFLAALVIAGAASAAPITSLNLAAGAAPTHVVVATSAGTPIVPTAVNSIQTTNAMQQCKVDGDATGWNLSCPSGSFTGTGTIVFASQGFTATLNITVVGSTALSGIEILQQ